ncbi:MAG: uracil phosphoribosyltransferase [Polyangiales bacterium]
MPEDPALHVLQHPLIQHKLTWLRRRETSTQKFRALLREMSLLFAYELTRQMPTTMQAIDTPLEPSRGAVLDGKKIVLVPVLRAGLGMVEGMVDILPSARIGHVGVYRDPESLEAVQYYFRMPGAMAGRDAIVVDPMLATGHSAVQALRQVSETGPRSLAFACILAAPEGLATLRQSFASLPVFTAAVDRGLDAKGYIRPGLGDAGDRLYGTKSA